MKNKIYFILGQTASGKTAFATKLAKELKTAELINCDSRQTYKYLDIITGKIDNPKDIPVHMVDLVDPKDYYSGYDYALETRKKIDDLLSQGITPIVVGGTGMYAYLLTYINPNIPKNRFQVPTDLKGVTIYNLQKELTEKYPFIWNKMTDSDKKNKRRLAGALHRLTYGSSSLIDPKSDNNIANKYETEVTILLHKDQTSLNEKLKLRVKSRLSMGAIEECKILLTKGYSE